MSRALNRLRATFGDPLLVRYVRRRAEKQMEPFKDVLDLLAAGLSEDEILKDYPDLQAENIRACLQYAAAQASHAVLRVP
jgi:hypothetical protein